MTVGTATPSPASEVLTSEAATLLAQAHPFSSGFRLVRSATTVVPADDSQFITDDPTASPGSRAEWRR